jgi:hypothetical protein
VSFQDKLAGLLVETEDLPGYFEDGLLRDVHPAELQLPYDVMLPREELS